MSLRFPSVVHSNGSRPLKILILKPSSLGDVVQAIPVLRLLKAHLPQSQIYWWIESHLAPLLEGDPDLSGLILFDRHRWGRPQNWGELCRSVRRTRAEHFDWVIDLQCLARSAIFAWLSNGGLTIGLDEPREMARSFYDLTAGRPSFHTHAVDWYLSVLPLLGIPVRNSFVWLPPKAEIAAAVRRKWPASDQACWIILQPGARWPTKRWPVESFAQLVLELAKARPDIQFAILGGAEDQPLGKQIAAAVPERCLDLTGRLSLPEMVEWIRFARLMITNDTGPMHVAAAIGTPLVALFGPTEPRRTGPYSQPQAVLQMDLPCAPCFRSRCRWPEPQACLKNLAASTVFKAVQSRLLESKPIRRPATPANQLIN